MPFTSDACCQHHVSGVDEKADALAGASGPPGSGGRGTPGASWSAGAWALRPAPPPCPAEALGGQEFLVGGVPERHHAAVGRVVAAWDVCGPEQDLQPNLVKPTR